MNPNTLERPISSYSITPLSVTFRDISQEGKRAIRGQNTDVYVGDSFAYKKKETDQGVEYALDKLNLLQEAGTPFPKHTIAETTDRNHNPRDVVARTPTGQQYLTQEDSYIQEIREICFTALEEGIRIDPRPSNWVVYGDNIAYIDTLDASSVKRESEPGRWMSRFIKNGLGEVEDELEEFREKEFRELARDLRLQDRN